jgi:hypothetical protein
LFGAAPLQPDAKLVIFVVPPVVEKLSIKSLLVHANENEGWQYCAFTNPAKTKNKVLKRSILFIIFDTLFNNIV